MKKNINPILVSIPLHLYPFNILVSIGHSDLEIDGILKRKGVTKDRDFCNYGEMGKAKYCLWPCDSIGLIRIRELPRSANDYAALMHEVLHIVISVLRQIGMSISVNCESDEAYAYLMSYLVGEIFHSINKFY